MSNLPPNPYNMSGPQQGVTSSGPPMFNSGQSYSQVPVSQLPPGYSGVKQDLNSNSPVLQPSLSSASVIGQVQNLNNYNQSGNNSPAFNNPGVMPLPTSSGFQSSPLRLPLKPGLVSPSPTHYQNSVPPTSSASPRTMPNMNISLPNLPNYPPQPRLINDTAPPINHSSQYNKPLINGPAVPGSVGTMPPQNMNQSSRALVNPIPSNPSTFGPDSMNHKFKQHSSSSIPHSLGATNSQHNVPFSTPPHSGAPHNTPLFPGPSVSRPSTNIGPPLNLQPHPIPQTSVGAPIGPPRVNGSGSNLSALPVSGALPGTSRPQMSGPSMGPPISGPTSLNQPFNGLYGSGQNMAPNLGKHEFGVPPSLPPSGPAMGPPSLPVMGHQMGPPTSMAPQGPTNSNFQNRYPPMPPPVNQGQSPYPQQYNTQQMTQQMGQLSVTKQGFDQLWGHHMVDLLQCKNILPEYPEDPPEIKLGHQFAEAPNCSPDIFRCTVTRIPETNSLLQKSRLPLGILIHPFKDLNHLPVIQCSTIVRCRACRTYINPFVYFVDAKRWKCNLCYRVNDLPEEFQYDPVSKSYGDPSRRPEIKSATIEFIAPGEYMLRPPQPAVYLFLMDVSQLARESGYLQVLCDTLKSSLDQLPGDARTQVGFICYDAHVHYYLMSDGLTRPKEMTVLDIDDIFLPSPESLLVNLGERLELVKELLTLLPQRHSSHGVPASALGAALQAAYRLMAPTGGRITVFQCCLPNVGPGALQPREDPNARSSKEVAHLNPATDFYKRLALDCSGAQIAVDLFVLNSQYADIATLSGMSKFSAGSVYHLPLFKASRAPHADRFQRILTRYLTRKIGFEAVMRVRATRGIAIHTFHGNFFVRSTDLLSLPNVSPDAGFGMQLTIEESLSDLQQVCFQAALLYTSSKGERRIRVHTLALPLASTLTDVLHSADQMCIIGLLSKMAVDRCASASMSEAREALMNVAVDALSAHRLAQNLPAGTVSASLHAPHSLRLLPLYLAALLKRKAFRTGTSTRLDDRVSDMCSLKTQPLAGVLRAAYPDLYPLHALQAPHEPQTEEEDVPDPPRLQLSAERISMNGAYLLDEGEQMIIYVCHGVSPSFLSETFGVAEFAQLPDEARSLPLLQSDANAMLHSFIDKLNDDRPYPADLLIIRDNSPSRQLFIDRLVDDRVESTFSYYEFLQHVKTQVK